MQYSSPRITPLSVFNFICDLTYQNEDLNLILTVSEYSNLMSTHFKIDEVLDFESLDDTLQ